MGGGVSRYWWVNAQFVRQFLADSSAINLNWGLHGVQYAAWLVSAQFVRQLLAKQFGSVFLRHCFLRTVLNLMRTHCVCSIEGNNEILGKD